MTFEELQGFSKDLKSLQNRTGGINSAVTYYPGKLAYTACQWVIQFHRFRHPGR